MECVCHIPLNALLEVLLIVTRPVLDGSDRRRTSVLLLHAKVGYLVIANAMLGLVIDRGRFVSQIIHSELIFRHISFVLALH